MDEWNVSVGVVVVGMAIVLAGLVATRQRRRVALGEVRLLPWNSIMLVGMIAAVFGAVHLLTLWRGA